MQKEKKENSQADEVTILAIKSSQGALVSSRVLDNILNYILDFLITNFNQRLITLQYYSGFCHG